MDEIPTPDLAVPYAAPILAKTRALVTPINPKKGALAGHVSISTLIIGFFFGLEDEPQGEFCQELATKGKGS
jgi:hypothetical protein